ncbi:hypothetical protein tinsulaeT_30480 [Thalassotalea insulae]|uniref:Sulfotransferase family protein n=1 Tax=Thalassotalea insulae TaxID=2056778 RepID=A0ABQ6GUW2_9GAMM|nr:sulfotransferase family protein [Thalassotalea insulae]GLX79708.1 hypothetical protein tinsulaeT_30480 [Thalassotalea insulae]
MNNEKVFIIGLPRTGTTSVCSKLLTLGYRVAHTAYTQNAFDQAQVIADTPIFCDYPLLDKYYPNSKFIYLTRAMESWLPSIKQLLQRMYINIVRSDGGFNPIIKRSYQQVFTPFNQQNINSDEFLAACYQRHIAEVSDYFSVTPKKLFTLDVSQPETFEQLHQFLQLPQPITKFDRLNVGGKITAWKDLTHPNKIASTRNGKSSALNYFNNV